MTMHSKESTCMQEEIQSPKKIKGIQIAVNIIFSILTFLLSKASLKVFIVFMNVNELHTFTNQVLLFASSTSIALVALSSHWFCK